MEYPTLEDRVKALEILVRTLARNAAARTMDEGFKRRVRKELPFGYCGREDCDDCYEDVP
jgi:hypothetical protein